MRAGCLRKAVLPAGREASWMFLSLRYLRGCVYPRGQMQRLIGSGQLRGSDAILGMMAVMLAVVGVAFALDMALF